MRLKETEEKIKRAEEEKERREKEKLARKTQKDKLIKPKNPHGADIGVMDNLLEALQSGELFESSNSGVGGSGSSANSGSNTPGSGGGNLNSINGQPRVRRVARGEHRRDEFRRTMHRTAVNNNILQAQ